MLNNFKVKGFRFQNKPLDLKVNYFLVFIDSAFNLDEMGWQ